jgi:hypothetical protein
MRLECPYSIPWAKTRKRVNFRNHLCRTEKWETKEQDGVLEEFEM